LFDAQPAKYQRQMSPKAQMIRVLAGTNFILRFRDRC